MKTMFVPLRSVDGHLNGWRVRLVGGRVVYRIGLSTVTGDIDRAGVGRPGGEGSGSMINDVVEQVCFLLFCAGRVIVRWAVNELAEEALRARCGCGCGVWPEMIRDPSWPEAGFSGFLVLLRRRRSDIGGVLHNFTSIASRR
jgi:hypothetical protein